MYMGTVAPDFNYSYQVYTLLKKKKEIFCNSFFKPSLLMTNMKTLCFAAQAK